MPVPGSVHVPGIPKARHSMSKCGQAASVGLAKDPDMPCQYIACMRNACAWLSHPPSLLPDSLCMLLRAAKAFRSSHAPQ